MLRAAAHIRSSTGRKFPVIGSSLPWIYLFHHRDIPSLSHESLRSIVDLRNQKYLNLPKVRGNGRGRLGKTEGSLSIKIQNPAAIVDRGGNSGSCAPTMINIRHMERWVGVDIVRVGWTILHIISCNCCLHEK